MPSRLVVRMNTHWSATNRPGNMWAFGLYSSPSVLIIEHGILLAFVVWALLDLATAIEGIGIHALGQGSAVAVYSYRDLSPLPEAELFAAMCSISLKPTERGASPVEGVHLSACTRVRVLGIIHQTVLRIPVETGAL
eukprot:scaffold624_cov402-Prasinococcus_capsulatus_cf.AAC.65